MYVCQDERVKAFSFKYDQNNLLGQERYDDLGKFISK